MKKTIPAFIIVFFLMLFATACSNEDEESTETEDTGVYEVALIIDDEELDDNSYDSSVWSSVQSICEKKGLTCTYYTSSESEKSVYIENVEIAVENGAGMIIFAGSSFETTAYQVQGEYEDIDFLLIDGMPHSKDGEYETADNMIGVMFAEEEIGFLAGYAAVKDGYTSIGFIGGEKNTITKRYGYGFVQGAAFAASEESENTEIDLRYTYAGTEEESDDIKEKATSWYESGTEVIFTSGSAISNSVISSAEKVDKKVIGVDVDQTAVSDTVVCSSIKKVSSVIYDMVTNYASGRFEGGIALNYTVSNDGISLAIVEDRLDSFTEEIYEDILSQLEDASIEIKKDSKVSSVKDVLGENITLID